MLPHLKDQVLKILPHMSHTTVIEYFAIRCRPAN